MEWKHVMTENFDRAKTWLKKLREIRFSVGHISWPFNLDLMLYLCSGQNDLVHQYECSVLSNDKSTVINFNMQKNDCYILLYHTPSYVCWSDHHAFRIFQCIIPLPHPLILVPTPQRCDLKWDIRPHSWSCIGISKYFFFIFNILCLLFYSCLI